MTYLSTTTQSKSRRRWIRAIGISACVALGCFSTAASAMKTDIGLEYWAAGYYVESDGMQAPAGPSADDSDDGFAHYLRVKANFKHEKTGISVHTSINVLGDRWEGDLHPAGGQGSQAVTADGNSSNALYVDYAYVQIPTSIGLLRVGRQTSNWAHCFLVCQDRRDRVLFITKFGKATALLGYDRRADVTGVMDNTNTDQIFAGTIIPLPIGESSQLGLLLVQFNDSGAADNRALTIFTPYLDVDTGMFKFGVGLNYVDFGWDNEPLPDTQGNALSGYLRVGAELGMVDLKAQYVYTQRGGIIANGFDTYSSLLNNNPASTQNPTSVYSMNSTITGPEQSLAIGNATFHLTPKFSVGASVGYLTVHNTPIPAAPGALGPEGDDSDGSMVYDLQAHYQVNKALRVWGTLGYLDENDYIGLNGNGIVPVTGSIANDGVMAGSINMGVKF